MKSALIRYAALVLALTPSILPAAVTEVEIIDFGFDPTEVTVNAGDSVHWVNNGSFAHTSTSDTGVWTSGSLGGGGGQFSFTFPNEGAFPYHCIPHPFMQAVVNVNAAANTAPIVSISDPTNGTVYQGPTNISITATATDSDGTVAQVEFFDGANSIGTATAEPFAVSLDVTPGSHLLTAVATDNGGLSSTSAPVQISRQAGVPIEDPIVERIQKGDITIELQTVAEGLTSPLGMAVPDDGSGRSFVYDQSGVVYVFAGGVRQPGFLMDIRNRLVNLNPAYDERGLLGLALHPNFAANPLVYTYSSEPTAGAADFPSTIDAGTTNNHQSVIAEWRMDPAGTNSVDPASRREILRIDKPQSNHNGGTMRFGPDGLLYFSIGDGGAADDQGNGHPPDTGNAQLLTSILGKLIRIDVDTRTSANGQYGVPSDNPFVGRDGIDEIYAYGLRNPYSFSFEVEENEIYLADVGQNKIEEIDIIEKGGNYGWRLKEGTFFFDPNGDGDGFVTETPTGPIPSDLEDPIAQYDHDDGDAVVSGFVYTGTNISGLHDLFVFGDLGETDGRPSGRLFYLNSTGAVTEFRIGAEDRPLGSWLKGFGEGADGELYVFVSQNIGPSGDTAKMLKIIPAPAPIQITKITRGEGSVTNEWTGGLGPFSVQKKANLVGELFCGAVYTDQRTASIPATNARSFFRIFDTARMPAIPLTAAMSGLFERPDPLTNSATGSATFALDGDFLTFNVLYGGLSGPATAAHIHGPATVDGGAGVLINLAPFNGGSFDVSGTLSGKVQLTAVQKAMVLAGLTYVNVHTDANGGGEVRGQIAPVMMRSDLNGANERPDPIETAGRGLGLFTLVGKELSFDIAYSGLSGPATLAHIHGPAGPEGTAGVLINLAPFNGGAFGISGRFVGSVTLTDAQLLLVIGGQTYVNIHTELHGGGEVRGQLLPQATSVPLSVSMSGLFERPTPLTNSAFGSGIAGLEGSNLTFTVVYGGLSGPATAAHIHGPATAAEAAGVLVNLASFATGGFAAEGTLSGTVGLTAAQRDLVLNGLTYVNVHTDANQGGEVRGQLAPVLLRSSLSGGNERPSPIDTLGTGSATLALVWSNITFNVTYRNLSSPANNAHFHGPAGPEGTASVLIGLVPFNGGAFGTSGSLAGTVSATPAQLPSVIDGQTYLNIHSEDHGGGEIRGQVVR